MLRLRPVVPLLALLIVGCGSTPAPSVDPTSVATATPAATPTPTAASSATAIPSLTAVRELVAGSAPLAAGTYTVGAFRPPVIFAVEDGWVAGTVSPGFFDVQQDQGSPDVLAVQFARVDEIVGASGASAAPATAAAAAEAIRQNPGVVVLEESASKVGGLDGLNVTIENTERGTRTAHEGIRRDARHRPEATPLGVAVRHARRRPRGHGRRIGRDLGPGPHHRGAGPRVDRRSVPEERPRAHRPSHPSTSPSAVAGPLGLDTAGDRAWVVLTDSGELVEVDLAAQRVAPDASPIGSGGSQVVASDAGPVYVGRYDDRRGRGGGRGRRATTARSVASRSARSAGWRSRVRTCGSSRRPARSR